jgi:hypothetical protein
MTMTDSTRAEIDSNAMRAFALLDSGIVSVGLKAVELVVET